VLDITVVSAVVGEITDEAEGSDGSLSELVEEGFMSKAGLGKVL